MEEKIIITNRKNLCISGATKVISSTATMAVVEVKDSSIVITGSNIEVVKLNLSSGEVEFSGEFIGIKYSQKHEKTSFFKRVFK